MEGEGEPYLCEAEPSSREILPHVRNVGAVDDGRGRILQGVEPVGEPAESLHLRLMKSNKRTRDQKKTQEGKKKNEKNAERASTHPSYTRVVM